MKTHSFLKSIALLLFAVLCIGCSNNTLTGKYVYPNDENRYVQFKNDGTFRFTDWNYFIDGTYELDGKEITTYFVHMQRNERVVGHLNDNKTEIMWDSTFYPLSMKYYKEN